MTRRAMERGHSFDYMQTDKDFFSPEYIRHIVKLRPWKGLVLISLREVLGLYLGRPLHNWSRVHDLGRALQIQRLEGSRPADVYGI
jgi:hypothetical protein